VDRPDQLRFWECVIVALVGGYTLGLVGFVTGLAFRIP
jgi:hypothetical protein